MLTNEKSLLTSKLVELKNTDSPHHEFHVHQLLIDELCHPLCDELREYWKMFDGETVGRFAQYLYQADCDLPEPVPVRTMTPPIGTSSSSGYPPSPESPGSEIASSVSDDTGEGPKRRILSHLQPLTPLEAYEIPRLHDPQESPSQTRPEPPTGHDYEAVFLVSAKLYILSYSQGIYALSDMCLGTLLNDLMEVSSPRNDKRILENVVELVRYAYCSPRDDIVPPKPLQPAWAELQSLASQFCALNIDVMAGNREFWLLLQEGGSLATDVMAKTVRRLGTVEASLVEAQELTNKFRVALVKANKAATTAEAALAEARKRTAAGPAYRGNFSNGSITPSSVYST